MAYRKTRWRKPRPRKPRKLTAREQRIMEAINSWGELSRGLTAKEKFKLAKDIRGSGKLPRAFQHMFRAATEMDLRALALFCCKAIIEKRDSKRTDRVMVKVRLPFSYRYSWPDFPIGDMVDADMLSQTYLYNANKLLAFLHEKGYSEFSDRHLRKYLGTLKRRITDFGDDEELAILNMYGYDSEILAMYEDILKEVD